MSKNILKKIINFNHFYFRNSAKKDKPVSSFNPNSQFPRRERFNSDPHTKTFSNNNDGINEQVVIDPSQVKYSLKGKLFNII
jgi:hypothetical protein